MTLDSSALTEAEEVLKEARAKVAEVEEMIGTALPADAKQRLDVARALEAVANAELALGWSQVPNAKVRELVRDPEQARAFLKEILDGVA